MVCCSCICIAFIILAIFCCVGSTIMAPVRKYFQGGQFKKDHIRIDGKVVIITGCNTGIGKCTAMDLAHRGAKVYMACRDESRCEAARQEIIKTTGNANVFNRKLDLSSLESVRSFVTQFLKEEPRLDILINNAGVMMCPKTLTTDGFECQIGVNHLGHFLLTNLLLDALKKAAPSRIVVLSSKAHTNGKIKKDDLNSVKSYGKLEAYSQSKLANVLFTRHLAKKLKGSGVTVNALHPGVVETELLRHIHPIITWLMELITGFMFKTPESGAQTTLHVALDPEMLNITGQYFSDCKIAPISKAAKNDETAEWLWNKSVELTHLKVE